MRSGLVPGVGETTAAGKVAMSVQTPWGASAGAAAALTAACVVLAWGASAATAGPGPVWLVSAETIAAMVRSVIVATRMKKPYRRRGMICLLLECEEPASG